jgi:hypothetical protein
MTTTTKERPATTHAAVDAWLKGATAAKPRTLAIAIANLKHMPSLSEETNAYTATVLIDGVRAFDASNHGQGGCDSYHRIKGYDGPDAHDVDAWLKVNTPKIESHGMQLDNCLEIIVGDLLEAEVTRKRLSRLLSSKMLVIDEKDGQPALYTYKYKPTPQNIQAMRDAIAKGKVKGRLVNGGDEAIMAEARGLV